MRVCQSCGGAIGRDCFNPEECAWITQQMNAQQAVEQAINELPQFGYWQLCPKCNGEKKVTVYYPETTGTISVEPCGICGGAGVLARPVINNENKQE